MGCVLSWETINFLSTAHETTASAGSDTAVTAAGAEKDDSAIVKLPAYVSSVVLGKSKHMSVTYALISCGAITESCGNSHHSLRSSEVKFPNRQRADRPFKYTHSPHPMLWC